MFRIRRQNKALNEGKIVEIFGKKVSTRTFDGQFSAGTSSAFKVYNEKNSSVFDAKLFFVFSYTKKFSRHLT